jgi:polysaccharide export outer membrane protein
MVMEIGGTARLFGTVAMAAMLAGCNATPPPVLGPVQAAPVASEGQAGYSQEQDIRYVLKPNDVVSVSVFREPALSLENVPIGADGLISLPVAGTIDTRDLTAPALAEAIAGQLARGYLRNPQVTVNVIQYASHRVTVEGAVEKPGVYEFKPGERLSSAIALASGPKREAKKKQIAVFRRTDTGLSVAKFDYAAIQQGTMIDPVLKPGDRVVVGTDGLQQFWQDFLKTLPAFAFFTNI